jgi:hypothetical protein
MPAALSSEFRAIDGQCWRMVEAQHHVSTLKLVDNLAEKALLEGLIEATKPPLPPECRHLDYLLATPFRYDAPYPSGSRFRRAGRTPGVFYASLRPETAAAEIAFYRLLFFAESPNTPWPQSMAEYTAFAAAISTRAMIDLGAEPLAQDRAAWSHLTDYAPCQALADAARAAGSEAIGYPSVRDPHQGHNLAILTCRAFAQPGPVERQTWRFRLGTHGVQAVCEFPRLGIDFGRDCFEGDLRIGALNWDRGIV